MKFSASTDIDRLEGEEEVKRWVAIALDQVGQILNNGLLFSDNFNAKILTVTFPVANVEVASLHGLGRVPSGYIQVGQTAATIVYDGSSANTASLLYLRASAAGTVRILVY